MPEKLTIPAIPNQPVVGYIVNSDVPEGLHTPITKLQAKLNEHFPGAIWPAPQESLHITLMDWLAPLVDYGRDKDKLFQSIEEEYTNALSETLQGQTPIPVTFDTIEVFPAAIIVKGHDNGSYERIRKGFLEKVALLPGTKRPPDIIHATICKFLKPIEVAEVKGLVQSEPLYYEGMISEFRLARENLIFMLQYEVLKLFRLDR